MPTIATLRQAIATRQAQADRVILPAQAATPLMGHEAFWLNEKEWQLEQNAIAKAGGKKQRDTSSAKIVPAQTVDSRVAELATRYAAIVEKYGNQLDAEGCDAPSIVGEGEHFDAPRSSDAQRAYVENKYLNARKGKLSVVPANSFGGSRDIGDGV